MTIQWSDMHLNPNLILISLLFLINIFLCVYLSVCRRLMRQIKRNIEIRIEDNAEKDPHCWVACPTHLCSELIKAADGGQISLDWFDNDDSIAHPDPATRPTVLLLPGLTGTSRESYILHMVQQSRDLGYRWVALAGYPGRGPALSTHARNWITKLIWNTDFMSNQSKQLRSHTNISTVDIHDCENSVTLIEWMHEWEGLGVISGDEHK